MEEYLPELAEPSPAAEARRRNAKIIAQLRAAANLLELAGQVDDNLPEVLSVGATVDEVTIQPWKPGAPVQAMRQFEALMTGATIERKAYPLVLEGPEQVSLLHAAGDVDGVRVVVSAATHRDTPVDGFLGVSEQAEAAIAAAETPIADAKDDVVLGELLAERAARDNGKRYPLDDVLGAAGAFAAIEGTDGERAGQDDGAGSGAAASPGTAGPGVQGGEGEAGTGPGVGGPEGSAGR